MAGAGAAASVAAAPSAGAGLAASYAAVQCTLRRQFFGDLVELRGALVNTLNLEPQRADNLHLKLQLIDGALRMLEENKAEVTSADMASLMNMSAKVVRAVEAWRARRASGQQDAAGEAQLAQMQVVQTQSASQQQQQQQRQPPPPPPPPPQQQQQQQAASQQLVQQQQQGTSQQQSVSQQQQHQQQATSQQQQQQSASQQQQQSAEEPQRSEQVLAVSVDGGGELRSQITSPFAAPKLQLFAPDPPRQAPTPVLHPQPPMAGAADASAGGAAATDRGDDCTGAPLSSVDQFDFLSKLIVDPVDPLNNRTASLLPDIDWEVPEVKPSGNLDSLLPSEASQVLLVQQRTVEQKLAAARAQRMSIAEAFLARVSANAAEQSFAGEGPGTSGTLAMPTHTQEAAPLLAHQQQQRSQRGALPPCLPCGPPSQPPAKQQKQHHPQQPGHREVPHDQLAAGAAAAGPHCPLASPRSAATSEPLGGPPQEISCHSGGGSRLSGAAGCATAVGSAGYPASGSTEPSPTGSYHQLPTSQGAPLSHQAVQLGGGYATAGLGPSPFSSVAAQGAGAGPAGQGTCRASVSAAAFGSTQLVHREAGFATAQQQQQHLWLGSASRSAPAAVLPPPPLGATASAGGASLGYGGGNAHSLQLSASSGRPGELHSSNPSIVGELQLLGLSSGSVQLGSQVLPPHLQSMESYTRQTAAAAQLAAADHQQAERLSALRLLQQFPHAALHGGCGALQQLLSAGDSFGAPGRVGTADPSGQLQQIAALQAQQQQAQLAQAAALERYRRDQLQFQQLQQQLLQPFDGFPQLQPQAPAYQQAQLANGLGAAPAGSDGMPALSVRAGGYTGLAGHSAGAGLPGMAAAANVQPQRVCPSLGAGAGSSGRGAAWHAPEGVMAVNPGPVPHLQAPGHHGSHGTYGSGGGFGESASLASGGSSRQKRRRA